MRRKRNKLCTLSRRSLRLGLCALLAGVCFLLLPAATWAHPLGNFSINRYSRLEVSTTQITIVYVLDMAEIPTFQEITRIDTNRDGDLASDEQAGYLARQLELIQAHLSLSVAGMSLTLEPQAPHLEFPAGQGGLKTLRLTSLFVATLPQNVTAGEVRYHDDTYAGRLGWQEIVVRANPGTAVSNSTAPSSDLSQELRNYPQDLLQSPLAVSSASFRFEPTSATGADLVTAPEPATLQSQPVDRFASLVTTPISGPLPLLLVLVAAFGLGAAHALTPGHGKTIVAAYLVGARGTTQHALFLGLTTTITHTAGVFALGIVTLFVSAFILPEQLYPWLGVISGTLVFTIGLTLFNQRLRGWLRRAGKRQTLEAHAHDHHHDHDHNHHHHDHDHDHHHHDHDHDHHHHDHDHDHHHHDHDHDHHHHDHDHTHDHSHHHSHSHLPPGADGSPITWRSLLALGVSGGLLPCPSALVVLLSAIALERVGLGLLLIVAFSLGLASVLTAIGILLVHVRRIFDYLPVRSRLLQTLPVVSALVVTLLGVGITFQSLVQAGVI